MSELLLELFSEEIPARMQKKAAERLKEAVCAKLVAAGLKFFKADVYRTPRRLTLVVEGVPEKSDAVTEERKGPRPDAPEAAINGFLKNVGLTREQLEIRETDKGKFYFAVLNTPGADAADIIAEITPEVIEAFPWPKSMRWGAGKSYWVRPLRSILCILTNKEGRKKTVDFTAAGVRSGGMTQGHRFMGGPPFAPENFADYKRKLADNFVILDQAEREEIICDALEKICRETGLESVPDAALLEEIVGLTEYPSPLSGEIEERFQDLPNEILRVSMRNHQKFFSLRDPETKKIKRFVTVSNIKSEDDGALILNGNLRVLAARLSDAAYFLETDLKRLPEERLEALRKVTFHAELGSQHERTDRIISLACEIARLLGADEALTARAATLCKTDLVTETVGEFPELQGVTGKYYALMQGEPEQVADAIEEHYKPQGPRDKTPSGYVSICVGLADKLDQLAGFWVIDEKPTGSKDPYALRRAALGVIRIILENKLSLNLYKLITGAVIRAGVWAEIITNPDLYDLSAPIVAAVIKKGKDADAILEDLRRTGAVADEDRLFKAQSVAEELNNFILERLKIYLQDRGARQDLPEAICAAVRQEDILLVAEKVNALEAFLKTEEGKGLVTVYDRAVSILTIEERKDGVAYKDLPRSEEFKEPSETALYQKLQITSEKVKESINFENVGAALSHMAALLEPINAFFDGVIVNCDEKEVRKNRLLLLNQIREVLHVAADFSLIEV